MKMGMLAVVSVSVAFVAFEALNILVGAYV